MASKKLYVHFDGTNGCQTTHVFKNVEESVKISSIVVDFIDIFNKSHEFPLNESTIEARDSTGALVSKKQCVHDFLEEGGCDLMLRETEQDQIQISKDLQLAFNYFSKGQYRSTRDTLSASQSAGEIPYVNCILADIKRENRQLEEASFLYSQVLDKSKEGNREASMHAHVGIAMIFQEMEQYEKAIVHYRQVLALLQSSGSNSQLVFECPDSDWVNAKIAECLYFVETPETLNQAITILNSLIKEDKADTTAHLLYSKILFDRETYGMAIRIVLKVVVEEPKTKKAHRQFVEMISTPAGFQALQCEVLLPSRESAPAYAFLATIAKDNGALQLSSAMLQVSVEHSPSVASYALNLAHIYEVLCDLPRALECVCRYLALNPSRTIFGVSCRAVEQRLEGILNKSTAVDTKLNTQLDGDDLDLLALWFTLVKILFNMKRLEDAAAIINLIEPLPKDLQLHLTTIRNENAYYCCIRKLLSTPGISNTPSTEKVYIIGDSHVLSLAWRSIVVANKSYLLSPRLVTGLKHWHLRKDTTFYPKQNFFKAIETIPKGSHVVFVAGEIDCREGILQAVEKCRYKDIDDGINHTIDIFMQALSRVVADREFKAYIHPIVPVLKETRPIVKRYNTLFQKKVQECSFPARWLDFFAKLLDENQNELLPEFELDGTHLHPMYLGLLSQAFEKAFEF